MSNYHNNKPNFYNLKSSIEDLEKQRLNLQNEIQRLNQRKLNERKTQANENQELNHYKILAQKSINDVNKQVQELNQCKVLYEQKNNEYNKLFEVYKTTIQNFENGQREINQYKTIAQQSENEVKAIKGQIQELNQYKLLYEKRNDELKGLQENYKNNMERLENEKNIYKKLAEKSEDAVNKINEQVVDLTQYKFLYEQTTNEFQESQENYNKKLQRLENQNKMLTEKKENGIENIKEQHLKR
ncbi:6279_t:CDS:1, partial [Funneliformis geosporum]